MSFARSMLGSFVAVSIGGTAIAATGEAAQRALMETYSVADEQAAGDDCKASMETLKPALASKAFSKSDEATRIKIYGLMLFCASKIGDYDAAYRYALAGTNLQSFEPEFWRMRLWYEMDKKRLVEAVQTVQTIASRSSEALNSIPVSWFFTLNWELSKGSDKGPHETLLAILSAPTYQPAELMAPKDYFKRGYAALLVERGDKAGAAALVQKIEEPSQLIEISVDPRLRDMLPSDFDARAAVERRLAKVREISASHLDSLDALLGMVDLLRQLGRLDEALTTLQGARPDGPLRTTYSDLSEQENWWWDSLSRVYQLLGRYDEAVAAMTRGVEILEWGENANVSQAINLGFLHLRFGQPAAALAAATALEARGYEASPVGEMLLRVVRGCARMALGQATAAKVDLEYAKTHEKDNPPAVTALLLCAGDMDAASASLIRRLNDPKLRSAALLDVSEYDQPPRGRSKAPDDIRLEELKTRPDVAAAIARAGGARRFHLLS